MRTALASQESGRGGRRSVEGAGVPQEGGNSGSDRGEGGIVAGLGVCDCQNNGKKGRPKKEKMEKEEN